MTGNGKFLPPIKVVIFHSYVSSQHCARATGNETPDFAFLYKAFLGGGMLTFLSTCSRHLCFVNIRVGLGGHVTVRIHIYIDTYIRIYIDT